MILTPSLAAPESLRIALPTLISSSNSPVMEIRRVSPIPSSKRAPSPIELLIVAWKIVPASVTPKWKG